MRRGTRLENTLFPQSVLRLVIGVPRFFVIKVDLNIIPHVVDVVRIATGEGIHSGSVLGVDDEDAADGIFTVCVYECA